MSNRIKSVTDVHVPLAMAYAQWTRVDELALCMPHVQHAERRHGRRFALRLELAGRVREFEAEVVEQVPEQRIRWRSVGERRHAGQVTFRRLDAERCRVAVDLLFAPEGLLEKVGGTDDLVQADVDNDLRQFAEWLEARAVSQRAATTPPPRRTKRAAGGAGPSRHTPPRDRVDATAVEPSLGAPDRVAPEWPFEPPTPEPAGQPRFGEGSPQRRCEVCGNEYDKAFTIAHLGRDHVFDCFECAIHALAPRCDVCSCRIVGHGMEQSGRMFCGAHCARRGGAHGLEDRA